MEKFIYVFSEEDCKKMVNSGYQLLKASHASAGNTPVYVFANDNSRKFDLDVRAFTFSNTLTF